MITSICIICGEVDGLENHHICPRSEGGSDEKENLITLCRIHHGYIHIFTTGRKNLSMLSKEGLARAKAQGKKLGTPANLTDAARRLGLDIANNNKKAKANAFATTLAPTLLQFQIKNMSLNKIAATLNELKIPTSSGKTGVWQANKVSRVLKFLDNAANPSNVATE